MNKNMLLVLAGAILAQAGCTMAPKYARPEAPVPSLLPTGPAYPQVGEITNRTEAARVGWREMFPDPGLQRIIETALNNNRDLRLAALNVERARALYGIQRAELLPAVYATGSEVKTATPADLGSEGKRQLSERYDVNLGVAAWEVDFFGRIRSLKDSALHTYLASEEARRCAQILLVSSVASAYLTLVADREKLALAQTTLGSQQNAYALVKRSVDLGLAAETDMYRAQTQVDAARGDLSRIQQLVAQDANALNLLAGAPVETGRIPGRLGDVTQPRTLYPVLSSDVLLLRPDVRQAEYLLMAANADIGAARATLFPRISLTSAFGTASHELSGLFGAGSDAWSFSPRISLPIFDPRAWSALKATKVQRALVLAQYEKAIQASFRDVADALAFRGSIDDQVAAQQSLVNAVSETYRLASSRYERGLDSYLSVLDAQRSLYAAQQGLVSLRLASLASQIRLYGALGGGAD